MSKGEQIYKFQGFYIPSRMMGSIRRYIDHGILPGEFLCAVLSNDLFEAMGRADEENRRNLAAFIGYFYNEAPQGCWGTKTTMLEYAKEKQAQRAKEKEQSDVDDATND